MGAGASLLHDDKLSFAHLTTLLKVSFDDLKVEGGFVSKTELLSGLQIFLEKNASENGGFRTKPSYTRCVSGIPERNVSAELPRRSGTPGIGSSRAKPVFSDPRKLTCVPHLSNKHVIRDEEEQATKDLGAVDLILWRLAEYVAQQIDSKTSTGVATSPATISWAILFRSLDLDGNKIITRDEWAIVLRRKIGVGSKVTDADLDIIFNDINVGNGS
jgi:hypothetical protein